MSQLLIALFMLFSTIVDGKIILDDPIRYPRDFDELYLFVETRENGWVFDRCEPGELTNPYLTWNGGVALFENVSEEKEERAFDMLLFFILAPREYALDFCGDKDGKPILFGPGLREYLAWFAGPEEYEANRFPVIAEGFVRNLGRILRIFLR